MLSYNRKLKGIVLTEHITIVESHYITWNQWVSKEGKIYGIGSFQQRSNGKRRGSWSDTLKERIRARHEKGKDWGGM